MFYVRIECINEQMLTDCRFVYRSAVSANGSFTSPNFPGLYPRHATCHYLFYANDDQRVFISFQYFDVDGIEPGYAYAITIAITSDRIVFQIS